jgi:hypothetical protein
VVEPEVLDGACESIDPLGVLGVAPEPESIGGLTAPAAPPELSDWPELMPLDELELVDGLELMLLDGLELVLPVAPVSDGVPVVAEALAPAPLAAIVDEPAHQSVFARSRGEARI